MTNPPPDDFDGGPTEANPSRTEQIEVLLAIAAAHRVSDPETWDLAPPRKILDAGCGRGGVAERLLALHPLATLVGFDVSPAAAEEAQQRLGGRARIVCASFDEDWPAALPDKDFDLIVCVQALHHVPDVLKRVTLQRFHDLLRPGGLYLQSDPVALGDAAMFPYMKALWNRLRARQKLPPLPEGYLQGDAEEEIEKGGDLLARFDKQLAWLKEAGFLHVDCFWKHGNRAIFLGLRSP
ncbi:MAG TPA: class I SAM-dependent methyltransferase [Planctomycetota bacterium]|nr:class I SAM-dependent methyltransferase [Planctomycetota bacterium]